MSSYDKQSTNKHDRSNLTNDELKILNEQKILCYPDKQEEFERRYIERCVSDRAEEKAVDQSKSPADTATAAEALEKREKLFFTYGKGGGKGSMGNADGTELSHVNPGMQILAPREQSFKHGGTTPPKSAAQTMQEKEEKETPNTWRSEL